MKKIAASAEANVLAQKEAGSSDLGIICSGISYQHVKEAFPEASVLKLGLTWPLLIEPVKEFVSGVKRCVVVEEGDKILAEANEKTPINFPEDIPEARTSRSGSRR